MDLQREVGRAIRQRREGAGLTRAAFAERIGRSVQNVGTIERGERAPSFKVLELMAGVLGVAVADFFPGAALATDDAMARIAGLVAPLTPAERERAYRILLAALKS